MDYSNHIGMVYQNAGVESFLSLVHEKKMVSHNPVYHSLDNSETDKTIPYAYQNAKL